jgi:hypothetical protein
MDYQSIVNQEAEAANILAAMQQTVLDAEVDIKSAEAALSAANKDVSNLVIAIRNSNPTSSTRRFQSAKKTKSKPDPRLEQLQLVVAAAQEVLAVKRQNFEKAYAEQIIAEKQHRIAKKALEDAIYAKSRATNQDVEVENFDEKQQSAYADEDSEDFTDEESNKPTTGSTARPSGPAVRLSRHSEQMVYFKIDPYLWAAIKMTQCSFTAIDGKDPFDGRRVTNMDVAGKFLKYLSHIRDENKVARKQLMKELYGANAESKANQKRFRNYDSIVQALRSGYYNKKVPAIAQVANNFGIYSVPKHKLPIGLVDVQSQIDNS